MKFTSLFPRATMALLAVLLTSVSAWADNVTYIDENGQEQQVDATPLTGSETTIGTSDQTTWYVVNSNLSYTSALTTDGDVRLILCDDKTLNIGTSGSPISSSDNGGAAFGTASAGSTLTIFGQANNTGALNAYGSNYGIRLGSDYKQHGGWVTATGGGRGVSAGDSFTITRGTLSATSGTYGRGIYAKGDVNLNGGTVTATATDGYGIYSRDRSAILAGATVTASEYTNVTVANCQAYSDGTNYYSGTLTSDELNAIKGKTMTPYGYMYIDADGNKAAKTFNEVTVLTGSETSLGRNNQTKWYVVSSNLSYTSALTIEGDVRLILCDDKTMTMGTSATPIEDYAISGGTPTAGASLTIYGQSQGTGALDIYAQFGIGVYDYYTQHGGRVTMSTSTLGITADKGITLNGGAVTASGSSVGINSSAGVTLSGAAVTADSYNGSVTIADGLTYSDGINHYSGTLTSDELNAIKGKTIMTLITGECGGYNDVLTWTYDQITKTLTISGTGDMADYAYNVQAPWSSYKQEIQSIVIGSGVETIGYYAFPGCTSLETLSFASGSHLRAIGESAFANCSNTNFTTLVLPASVKRISRWAFSSCSGLTKVTIGSGVEDIYNDAFYYCTAVTDVYCYADPTALTWEDGCNDFKNSKANTICHVYGGTDAENAWTSKFDSNVCVTFQGDLAPTAATASVNEAYWSTYYNSAANMKADANTTVYKAALDGENVVLTEISDKVINAGQAVVLKRSTEGAVSLTPQADASTDDYSDNILHGVDARTATATIKGMLGYGTLYVLGNKNSHFGFHKYTAANMPANKAFLLINGSGAALAREYFGFNFDETTTAINDVRHSTFNVQQVYDLQGRKVANPTRGMYVNGKKVIVK